MRRKTQTLRTNLMTLAASAMLMYVWFFFVWHGVDADLPDRRALGDAGWLLGVLSLVPSAVGLQYVKDLRTRRAARRVIGAVILAPFFFLTLYAWFLRLPTLLAAALPAFACALRAVWVDEPEAGPRDHDLLTLCAGAILLALPVAAFIPGMAAGFPMPLVAMLLFALLGAASMVTHLRRPGNAADKAFRVAMAAAFLALCVASYFARQFVPMLAMAPYVILLLAHPLLATYRAGLDPREAELPEEAAAVHGFIKTDERAGWVATSVLGMLCFFYPPMAAHPNPLPFLTVLFVFTVVFVVQYRLIDPKKITFKNYHSMMHSNVIGIGLQAHFTGGLDSPAALWMPFMVWAGVVTPKARFMDRQTALVSAYFVIEGALAWRAGTLAGETLFVRLLPLMLVSALVYIFIRRVALERNEMDERLLRSNAALTLSIKRDDALFAALADAVFVCSPEGTVVQTNAAAAELVGRIDAAVCAKPDEVLKIQREDGGEFSLEVLLVAAKRGQWATLPDDLYMERTGGARTYVAGHVAPFVLDDGKLAGVVITIRDITAVHEADMVKADFLSIAAHQLRAPLTNIRWHLELVKETAETFGDQTRGFLANAYGAARRMVELINGILAAARLESGRVPFKPEPVALRETLDEIIASVKDRADAKKQTVTSVIPDLPPVSLDPTLAREVFKNLVENGVRYTPEGGKITVSAEDRGGEIAVTVEDNGIGIPAEQQKKIFAKFFRAKNAIAHTEEGTGLGLFLARYIANAWGGDVTFESVVGKGTKFHVTIPKKGMASKKGEISLSA